jgi:patatin-like phospholipase/acyl hydrolase
MAIPEKNFKILTIDGGGIKGLYSAKVLQHLEEQGGCISDHFDMICGTSTGGIIALALSLKIPAKDIVQFYVEKGPTIFPNRNSNFLLRIYDTIRQVALFGKFNNKNLRDSLQSVFGDRLLGESHNLVCIPSYDVTEGTTWIFKKNYGNLGRDDKTRYVDIALATSAAPTYFPMAELPIYFNKQFIDGGVWANNPTMVGYVEAMTNFVGPEKDFNELSILSLSSLSVTGGMPTGLRNRRGFVSWRNDLFETSMTGQSEFIEYYMKNVNALSKSQIHYQRIPSASVKPKQVGLVQLDIASKTAIDLILGKGDDQGLIFRKKPEVMAFFAHPKNYIL